MVENNVHKGNYEGTKNMHADSQDMEFVNDTLEEGADKNAFAYQKPQQQQDQDQAK